MSKKMHYISYTADGKGYSTSLNVATKADAIAILEKKHNAKITIRTFRPNS